jgi:hypothetical protein
MVATVVQLEDELLRLVREVPAFASSGFSVFDLSDASSQSTGQTLPVVSVAYDGSETVQGNQVTTAGGSGGGAALVNVQFVIVMALQYSYTGADDTKQQAFALLDQVRAKVLGFKGVNTRPWRFLGERPEPNTSGDGVVFYSQVWQTTLPIVGNSQ